MAERGGGIINMEYLQQRACEILEKMTKEERAINPFWGIHSHAFVKLHTEFIERYSNPATVRGFYNAYAF